MGEPKTGSGDQNHDHEAVFDVAACLQGVVPEVENLRDMAAKTNQEKQERSELKKVSPHFTVSKPPQIVRAEGTH
jgi:hypothetical protein